MQRYNRKSPKKEVVPLAGAYKSDAIAMYNKGDVKNRDKMLQCGVYGRKGLPNAALNCKVPYVVLMKATVDYNDLKTFGCLDVAYNNTHGGDKFTTRGIPIVFVRYLSLTKGYKLLNLQNM